MIRFGGALLDLGQVQRITAVSVRHRLRWYLAADRLRVMKSLISLFCLLATPLGAHPHVFVNTGIEVIIDAQDRLTHLRITWEYDELYLLLVTEDLEIDDDYDEILTQADLAKLKGFDMNWIDGFNGDLVVTVGDAPVTLSSPMEPTATMENGKIITTHLRAVVPVSDAAGGETVSIKPFDATYYTAYDVTLPVIVKGREDCKVTRKLPDLDDGLRRTQAELAELPPEVEASEAGFADIGERFATEIVIACDAP